MHVTKGEIGQPNVEFIKFDTFGEAVLQVGGGKATSIVIIGIRDIESLTLDKIKTWATQTNNSVYDLAKNNCKDFVHNFIIEFGTNGAFHINRLKTVLSHIPLLGFISTFTENLVTKLLCINGEFFIHNILTL